MISTLRKFFDFCNEEDRKKLYLAIVLSVVKAVFAALRISAIAVFAQGVIEDDMTNSRILLSLGIMLISVIGQIVIGLKITMLQTEAGYHSCAHKRIEIAEHLRYLPMGFFNHNSLGSITNVTTNVMESLSDIATRIIMVVSQGILTTTVIAVFVFAFDWRIGLILLAGIVIFVLWNTFMQKSTKTVAPMKHAADEAIVTAVIEYVQGIAEVKNVDEGVVKLGGRNVKDYSFDSLMKNFSFVFQRVYLFEDTIANNIRFGKPDASMDEVIAAAKKARCDDFIRTLPDGYDTVIGEGGASLSGGEKQRISIARAILKDSPIIILDEATANVDPENEAELTSAIEELTKEKTIIMIAHRLKTVRHADQIFVIDEGRIAQHGTHDELVKEEGIYKQFILDRQEAASWKIAE